MSIQEIIDELRKSVLSLHGYNGAIQLNNANSYIDDLEQELSKDTEILDKIVQVSGFGCRNTPYTQTEYMLVGLSESGRVLLSTGDGIWADVTTKTKAIERSEV